MSDGIGPVAGALGSAAIGALANIVSTREVNNANAQAWREQAVYNTPANQVKRLRAAGLNPGLAMQNGLLSSGEQSQARTVQPYQDFDFSPVGNAMLENQRIQNEKMGIDAEIRNKDANTIAQNQKNVFGMQRGYFELLNTIADLKKKGADTSFLEKQAAYREKEIKAFEDRNSAEVYKIRQEGAKAEQEAIESAMRSEYQRIVNQYAPQSQEKMLANLDAQHASLMAAAASGNAAAARDIAMKALTDAQKQGVEIDNDTKDRSADALVDKAFNEAENAYFTSGNSGKQYYGGYVGTALPT